MSVASHSASVGRERIELPSSLTEPTSIGTFFEMSGAPSKKDRIVMTRPSTLGPEPTRRTANGPAVPGGGFIFAATAMPASLSRAHSIFCSAAMSVTPSSAITRFANSLDSSAVGRLPPPPDCADARWMRPSADGIPRSVVTLEPPPDWP